MKRLILLSMMFIASILCAEEIPQAPAPVLGQSAHDDISVSIANLHHIDLDNTEIDSGGNWLNKRIWYERAQTLFDEILVAVGSASDLRIQFSNEVNAIGQKIDSFFELVGFSQGELDDKFKEILVTLETKQKIVGDLSEEERNLQVSVKQALPAVDQIEKDIKSIGEVDKKIDQVFIQACKTIDECRDFEAKAWNAFKTIAKELDDKKARNLYYQMSNYKQNIEQKSNYLKSTLLPYLHNLLVAKIEKNITEINSAIAALKTKGLDLEKIMKKNQEDDSAEFAKREKQAAEIAVKKAVEEEQAKAKIAAEKAAKDLEEAHKKSFSNVVNAYYDKTIGKIVGFFYPAYDYIMHLTGVSTITSSIKSYSLPVATSGKDVTGKVKLYMHDLVEHLMSYFGTKSKKSKSSDQPKITENQEKNDTKVEDKIDVSKDLAGEIKLEDKSVAAFTPVVEQKEQVAIATSVPVVSVATSTTTTAAPVEQAAISTSVATSTVTSSNDQVIVQSLGNDNSEENADQHMKSSNVYQLFTTIFDLIGTVFISLYNCFLQFLKLLYNFASYINS